MWCFFQNLNKITLRISGKPFAVTFGTFVEPQREDEFRILNLKNVKGQVPQKRVVRKVEAALPRTTQMVETQDWGNVWPGPRSFHPATVPLPIRQGYAEKGVSPGKYGNAELMKIPNFLHLTPPVIKRHCEALKKLCTSWPKNIDTDEKCDKYFPIQVSSSTYCHSSPTISDPLARIVTVRFKLESLKLNSRAKDKFLRLVEDRYDEKTDIVTIVTDRCPLQQQNYDYAMYLITALYHESWNVEPWEKLKTEADMESYNWDNNISRKNVERIFGKSAQEVPNIQVYSNALDKYMNEGETLQTIEIYGNAVRTLLKLPSEV